MARVLIFGATGGVGTHTAISLRKDGHDVSAIGHRPSDNGFFADYGIEYYSIDIKDASSFSKLPKEFDCVIHFAGAMPARMKGYHPHEYIDTIINGTLNILEYMNQCGCKKIIFAQSIADINYLFGTTNPISDDVERKFPLATDHSVYSISKNAAVNLIEHYHAQYGFDRFILRLPTIYVYHPTPYFYYNGERKYLGYRYIIDQAIKGEPLQIWGNPKSKKEMVYVKDFVQLVTCCVNSNLKGGIYNVGCGNPVSIEEQIRTIAEIFATDKVSKIEYAPEKPSSPQFVLSIEKAKKDLGYSPQYDFRKMMIDFKKEMEELPFRKLWGI